MSGSTIIHQPVPGQYPPRCRDCHILLVPKSKDDATLVPAVCHVSGCTEWPTHFTSPLKPPQQPSCVTHHPNFRGGIEVKTRHGVIITLAPRQDWCMECGHTADAMDFVRAGQCPNPTCPRPWKWD